MEVEHIQVGNGRDQMSSNKNKSTTAKVHRCRKCQKSFNSHMMMRQHEQRCLSPLKSIPLNQNVKEPKSSHPEYKCSKCQETFTRVDNKKRHEIKCSQTLESRKCRNCQKQFDKIHHLKMHEQQCIGAISKSREKV